MDGKIINLLNTVFDKTIKNLRGVGTGLVKEVYLFEIDNKEYVLSLSSPQHGEDKPFLKELLKRNSINTKEIIASGIYDDLIYTVTNKIEGETLNSLNAKEFKDILPEVIEKITDVHKIDICSTDGFGWLNETGSGRYKSIEGFFKDFFSKDQIGFWEDWYSLFDSSFLDLDSFNRLYGKMMDLVKYTKGRYLTHGDFSLANMLTLDNRITGIIDWDNVMYGDFVYDVACLQMELPEYEIKEAFLDYYRKNNFDVQYFDERFICMSLCRGLDSLRFFSKFDDKKSYDSVLKYLNKMV